MDKELNVKELEALINDVLPGLTMYVRDVNLAPAYAVKYEPGMIIRERGFTDASNRVMGMATTHRYAILSNHMRDLRGFEHGTNWGLFVAKSDAHFKVLDVYTYQDKTQILLLHLPDDSRWSLFKNVKISIEDELISDSRKRFEDKCMAEVIPELATEVWLDRCKFPVGMSDEGEFFDNVIELDEKMNLIRNANFRDLYHQLVYIRCPELLKRIAGSGLEMGENIDGVIAYGYIDEECGLSFHIFATAGIKYGTEIVRGNKDEKSMLILRRGSVADCKYLNLSEVVDLYEEYELLIEGIHENYDTDNQAKEEMRYMTFLDEFRHEDYPDDVAVVIFREGMNMERVWVRCVDVTDEMLYGILLNEPHQEFGVHEGDKIGFVPFKGEEGLLLVAHIE